MMGSGEKKSSPGVILLSKQAVKAAPSPPISLGGRAREHPCAGCGRVASVIRPHHQSLGTSGRAMPLLSPGTSVKACDREPEQQVRSEDGLSTSPTSSDDKNPHLWAIRLGTKQNKSSKDSRALASTCSHNISSISPWQKRAQQAQACKHCLFCHIGYHV